LYIHVKIKYFFQNASGRSGQTLKISRDRY
jgi:hypothetical protein